MNFETGRTVRWRRWLFVALVVGLAIAGSVAAKRGDGENVYLPAGQRLMNGQDIFRHGYVYPPFQALLAAPFAALPKSAARIAWACLNALAGGVFVLGAWRLTGGDSLWKKEKLARREWWIFALGFAAAIGFIFDAITNGQTDLLIAALITIGCLLLPRTGVGGGALIGVAAAAKCTPLLFVPWLAWRRRWMAAVCLLLAALAVNLLPDIIFPNSETGLRFLRWAENFFAPLLRPSYAPGTWYTALDFNHSLAGASRRLLPAAIARPAWLASCGVLLLAAISAMLIFRSHGKISNPDGGRHFEIGAIVCLMLLLSPVSSKPHFSILLLPAWAVARAAFLRSDRILFGVSILAALTALVVNKDLVGALVYDAAKWWGVITLETLLLFGGCLWALRRRPDPSTSRDDYVDLRRERR